MLSVTHKKVLFDPDTKLLPQACVWVRGRCGKLLPENLRELMDLSSYLVEELSYLIAAIDEWIPSTISQPHGTSLRDSLANSCMEQYSRSNLTDCELPVYMCDL